MFFMLFPSILLLFNQLIQLKIVKKVNEMRKKIEHLRIYQYNNQGMNKFIM